MNDRLRSHEMLLEAADILCDSDQHPAGMASAVTAFKALTGITLTEQQGWLLLALLELARTQQSAATAETYTTALAALAQAGQTHGFAAEHTW